MEKLLLVCFSLPEAPGLVVLGLPLLERGSGAALGPQGRDGALLESGPGLRRDVCRSLSDALHLRQLQIHLLAAEHNTHIITALDLNEFSLDCNKGAGFNQTSAVSLEHPVLTF